MKILTWEKIPKTMSSEDWKKISADGAPPGVYRPNMSEKDMLKWKAKLILGDDPRVEIRKTFHWNNGKSYPDSKNFASQVLIQVRPYRSESENPNDNPGVLLSTNGKVAMTHSESIMIGLAIEEAKLALSVANKSSK